MVYSPTMYLVASAVAAATLQMQQAAATSLRYDPIAILSTTESTNSIFSGMAVDDEICKFEWHRDPTLPDLATIARTVVLYPDLLSNQSTPPDAVHLKVGINVVLSDPTDNLDEYAYVTSGSVPNLVVPATKTDTKTPTDCATGWDKPMTPNTDDSIVSGNVLTETAYTERRLEELDNEQIVTLENYFKIKMETTLAKLPTVGVVSTTPWPGPYWPTYQDSINVQIYQNEYPISAKYALAFDLNVKDFMDKISKEEGIDMDRLDKKAKTVCTVNGECNAGSVCAIRTDYSSGFCIPKWWGICNAWSSAAILEQEPNCPVTHNNVTFYPLELKGLLSYIHNTAELPYVFTGVRFNGDDAKDVKDEHGRSKFLAFNDMNPGSIHIVIANILGKLGKSFIVDIEPGKPVCQCGR